VDHSPLLSTWTTEYLPCPTVGSAALSEPQLFTIQSDTMANSKLPLGPHVTIDKNGRQLFWLDRKRVKEDAYLAAVDASASELEHSLTDLVDSAAETTVSEPVLPLFKVDLPDPDAPSVMEELDALLLEVRRHFQPSTTDKERALLALCQIQDSGYYAGYAEALAVTGSPMAANALIGSLQRKGLIRYESKEEARFRLTSDQGRYFMLTSPEVQKARIIEPTIAGMHIGDAQLNAELTNI